jgi:hypothetical protein
MNRFIVTSINIKIKGVPRSVICDPNKDKSGLLSRGEWGRQG